MSSINPLDKEILKYEKKGYDKIRQKTLKFGTRVHLKKKGGLFGNDDDIYIYYPQGEAGLDCLREFVKDYERYFKDNEFLNGDKGLFLCTGSIDEKLFKDVKQTIKENDIRSSVKLMVSDSADSKNVDVKKNTIELKQENNKPIEPLCKEVFIVHGTDHAPVKELEVMLYRLGLKPTVLREQANAGRTIVEKLEHCSKVGYAFIILTPDDLGGSNEVDRLLKGGLGFSDFIKKVFPPNGLLKTRARQNVILEFGYFMGLLGRKRVCCLYKGDIDLPSDMQGIAYIRFDDSIDEIHSKITTELKEAGYNI